jgi:predicted nucleic acid-binding protein
VRLYLDANAIIFAHEGPKALQRVVAERIIQACLTPSGVIMTSLLAELECRTKPLREKNYQLSAEYEFFFQQSGLEVLEITRGIIERATELRADYQFRTPDAIHLASALNAGADLFLTRDKQLARFPGIQIEIIDTAA